MALGEFLYGEERVAQPRGLLVVAARGCFAHGLFDLGEYRRAASFQKRTRFVETLTVFFRRHTPDARRRTRPYHVCQAVAVSLGVRLDSFALADSVSLLDEILCGANDRRRRKRTEILVAVVADYPDARETRPCRRRLRLKREIPLVVAHQDVEMRLVFFD